MSDNSKIEWTDASWNPVRGCSIVSKGCTNCYAMKTAHRFSGPGKAYDGLTMMSKAGPVWNGEIKLIRKMLQRPLRWKEPRRIFVNSMSDLFHEKVPFEFIDRVFAVMALASQHKFQVLTKRPERMLEYLSLKGDLPLSECPEARIGRAAMGIARSRGENVDDPNWDMWWDWPLPNVWLGVSVEDQKTADERIPLLLQTPAAVRWISAEPLLGPIDIRNGRANRWSVPTRFDSSGTGIEWTDPGESYIPVDWVVVGGESGHNARPMHPDWARALRDQCNAAGVPFFFKQWGAWKPDHLFTRYNERLRRGLYMNTDGKTPPLELASVLMKGGAPLDLLNGWQHFSFVGKEIAGRHLDGRTWDEYPI